MGLETIIAAQGLQAIAGLGNSYSQASAIRGQSAYESQGNLTNAEWARIQATGAEKRGEFQSQQLLQQARQMIGQQRVSAAAQGVDVNTGSVADLQEQTAGLAAADAEQLKTNAFLEALGYRSQASSMTSRAKMARVAGKHAATSSLLTGGLNFLRAGAQTGYMMNNLYPAQAQAAPGAVAGGNAGESIGYGQFNPFGNVGF